MAFFGPRTRLEFFNRGHDLSPMADDGDAEVLRSSTVSLRQHRAVDLIVPERRLILPKAKAPQPNPDVHRRFLRPARMMILRSHGVYGFGPYEGFGGKYAPLIDSLMRLGIARYAA